jgi:hypothetical protein
MENNDLGSKKMNNKQTDENIEYTLTEVEHTLTSEVETDSDGNHRIVQRSRGTSDSIETVSYASDLMSDTANPSSSIEILSDEQIQRMRENQDFNSDIISHRYKNSDPDNKEDRGNIKLDE